MSAGSLFSGIGGLDLAVEHVFGVRTAWQVECDPFCRDVLATHWPEARRFHDVRTALAEGLDRVEIIGGGFPCQDVSVAGKRKGLAGARSGLWRCFADIVRALRPRVVVVENVPGLLSMEFGDVLGDLAEMGFAAEWGVFAAADVGAPHLRERVFLVALADAPGPRPQERTRGAGATTRGVPELSGSVGAAGAVADAEFVGREGEFEAGAAPQATLGSNRSRLADTECIGQPITRQFRIGEHSAAARVGSTGDVDDDCSRQTQPGLGGGVDGVPGWLDAAARWPSRRGQPQHPWEPPRVTQDPTDRRRRLKALGNAVCPQQAVLALRVLLSRFAER